MAAMSERMLNAEEMPDDAAVARWLGDDAYHYWLAITGYIAEQYPGIFVPDWLFGGKKHGWSLRYKKSKSFCTLIPERDRLMVQIVLGGEERKQVEEILPSFTPAVRASYESATTYHDGKWLGLTVDSPEMFADVQRLLVVKRKPKAPRKV